MAEVLLSKSIVTQVRNANQRSLVPTPGPPWPNRALRPVTDQAGPGRRAGLRLNAAMVALEDAHPGCPASRSISSR